MTGRVNPIFMLHVVATPIGDLSDVSLRALEILKKCDFVIGEDHRVASTLLKKLGIEKKEIHLLNEHSKKEDIRELASLCSTHNCALISDCGTPGFSDPGAELIQACRAKGTSVTAVPGASSLMTILSLSSQKISQFVFIGFLPAKKEARTHALSDLKKESRCWVLMDTPYRLKSTLEELAREIPNERGLLGLNLTQPNEAVYEGSFKELQKKCELESAEFIILRYAHALRA